ncbi:dynein regulatory complex protein 8-like isoform X1 [Branchiostoma floridae]|uniref:Dynein regulatory complex protein 8-like isoform X1 n=1 Tax=Branchiostoma floridae TaxID=7739 RepID=A0A9J7LX75_BRAFL|nr:dynein regulatory complex protein 8-like isoform X1 [Branchiostoma floridae]
MPNRFALIQEVFCTINLLTQIQDWSVQPLTQTPLCLKVDTLLADIQKKITEAFDIFDHESNKTVDVREIGTIIRSLGCCPTEGELHDMLAEIEEEEPTGYIRFDKFLQMMTHVMLERRYKPVPEEMLLKAFAVLDQEKKGFLSQEELQKYMSEEGEPFTQEEMEEMLSAAVDPDKGVIYYKDFASMMAVENP